MNRLALAQTSLCEITADNWRECAALTLKPHQTDFVSSSLFSLAQSRFEPQRIPAGIINHQGVMVGFAFYNTEPLSDGATRFSRLLIDHRYQNGGYGRQAAHLVIDRMFASKHVGSIQLDCHAGNSVAHRFWESLGFEKEVEHERYAEYRLVRQRRSQMQRLFVYGTLVPGAANHREVADIDGYWQPATLRGRLYDAGWGADSGCPGMVVDVASDPVSGYLLSSNRLAACWDRLDAFEGQDYCRQSVDVVTADGICAAAEVYGVREDGGIFTT